MKKGLIIFSGYNIRAVISFIRTLEKKSVSYGIVAKSDKDDIFKTSYNKKVFFIRKKEHLDLNDLINSIICVKSKLLCDQYIIAPSTEALNRFFLDNIASLEAIKCILPIVNKKTYELISDKYTFGELCKNFNIKTPFEYADPADSLFPFIAKPRKYFSGKKVYKPMIIRNNIELDYFIGGYCVNDFYFQEYVDGQCIYFLYYFYKNGGFKKYSQENFLQQESGGSMLVSKSSDYHNSPESDKFEKMFLSVNYQGLVMIELKLINNVFIMIEANPRFWGPSQLFVDSGVNFFESLLSDNDVVMEGNTVKKNHKYYFWDDGVSKNFKERKKIKYHNYSEDEFKVDLMELSKLELFNREDTIKLYQGNING